MLYVVRLGWAVIYFVLGLVIALSEFALLFKNAAPWLRYFSFNFVLMAVCSVHAYRIAAYGSVPQRRPWYSRWYGLTTIYLVPLLAIFLGRAFLFEPFRFPSGSVFPTIKMGAYLIVKKWGYGNYGTFGISVLKTPITADIQRGDIVVFDFPGDPAIHYAKRIVGIPGDVIELKGRRLEINGKPVESSEPSAAQAVSSDGHLTYATVTESLSGNRYKVAYARPEDDKSFSVTVPSASYFVLGDNRDYSNDSRYWGFVPAGNIVGKVVYVIQ